MSTETAIQTALSVLGGDPYGVAAALERAGVKGVPGRADSCPIANYLSTVLGASNVYNVKVTGTYVLVNGKIIRCSDAVKRFVRLFDSGAFPRLNSYSPVSYKRYPKYNKYNYYDF